MKGSSRAGTDRPLGALAHRLSEVAVVSRALITSTSTQPVSVPTYGELLGLARRRAHVAAITGSGPFGDAEEAAAAISGFERYLAVIGKHLHLVMAPGLDVTKAHVDSLPLAQQLIQRLGHLQLTPSSQAPWGRAADTLATAHDLLATHLGPFGERRSAEIDVLADPRHRQAAARMVVDLLDEPVNVRGDLLRAVSRAQRGEQRVPSTRSVAAHVRQHTDVVAELADRFLVATPATHLDTTEITSLAPAVPRPTGAPAFADSLQALRTLRLLSYRQSLGLDDASPGSLHDMVGLARSVTSQPQSWLPVPATPIARIQRANALDQLSRANGAWTDASTALGQHIRGLSKAPRVYAEAIGAVQATPTHEGVRRAVLAALPRLGHEAGLTAERLSRTGSLTIATKPVGRFQESWRLLSPEEGDALAARFTQAGDASVTANVALIQLDRSVHHGQQARAAVRASQLERGRAMGGRAR